MIGIFYNKGLLFPLYSLDRIRRIVYTKAMIKQKFKDKITAYLKSPFFLVSLAIVSFLCFLIPGPFNYIPVSVYRILALLPLFQDNGIYYSALLFFIIPSSSRPLRDKNLPLPLLWIIGTLFLSLIFFFFICKPRRRVGTLFYSLLALFILILTSYCVNAIKTDENYSQCWFFIIIFFAQILLYRRRCSATSGREGLNYLSFVACALSVVFFAEILLTILLKKDISFFIPYDLPYSSGDTVSCLIIYLLPLIAYGIFKKRWYRSFFAILNYVSLILLGNYISYIFLLMAFIPLIFLSFHSYGKIYPYLILISLFLILTPFCFLLFLNRSFSTGIINSMTCFNVFSANNPNYGQLSAGWSMFHSDYLLGSSILSLATRTSVYSIPNAYLQIGVLSGSRGIAVFILSDFFLYKLCSRGKTRGEKFFFLYFLILREVRNWLIDSGTNWMILLLSLTIISVYQGSIYQDQRIIHDGFENLQDRESPLNQPFSD